MYWPRNLLIHRSSDLQTQGCSELHMYRSIDLPMHQSCEIQRHRSIDLPIHRSSDIQPLKKLWLEKFAVCATFRKQQHPNIEGREQGRGVAFLFSEVFLFEYNVNFVADFTPDSPWGPASPLFPFPPFAPSPLFSRPIGENSCSQSGVIKEILLPSVAIISLAYILTFLTP